MKATVSIINVTSYTALELLRFLSRHPHFQVTSVTARSAAGQSIDEIFPQLQALVHLSPNDTLAVDPSLVVTAEAEQTDLAFVCLPHAAAAEAVAKLLQTGTKVVDLSADFRLHDVAVYEEWYKHVHPAPSLLKTAAYGLPERYRNHIQESSLVANPGCHATTSILALIPAFAAGIVEPAAIVDSKTGVSGAGRSPSLTTLYSEVNEDVNAYGLDGHRHLPEIVQELKAAAFDGGQSLNEEIRLTFLPHLLPMTRGILASCYADLKPQVAQQLTTHDVVAMYKHYYADEPFVHVVEQAPHTKWTYGSNHCFIHPCIDKRTQRLVVISCLDNLVKGASGQALQNANLLCGFPETVGLDTIGVHP